MALSSAVVTEDKLLHFKTKNDALYAKKSELTGAYTLPEATESTLGGVKIGDNIKVSNGTISVDANPTKVSELTNDSKFQTESQLNTALANKQDKISSTNKLPYSNISGTPTIPSKTSQLTNDSGYITDISGKQDKISSSNKLSYSLLSDTPTIPTKTSQLTNDSNYVSDISGKQDKITTSNKLAYSLISGTPTIPSKVSDLTNDSSFQTASQVSSAISSATSGLAKSSEVTSAVSGLASTSYVDGKVSGLATTSYVDGKISTVYKPAGSVTFANLPTLSKDVLGNVYNVSNSFNTTADFVEGAGKSHPAGTNVAVVQVGTAYKFDVLAGFVDLSGYVTSTELVEITNEEIDSWFK